MLNEDISANSNFHPLPVPINPGMPHLKHRGVLPSVIKTVSWVDKGQRLPDRLALVVSHTLPS